MHKQAGVMYVISLGVHISVHNVPFQSTVIDFYSNLCTNSATVRPRNVFVMEQLRNFLLNVHPFFLIFAAPITHLNEQLY